MKEDINSQDRKNIVSVIRCSRESEEHRGYDPVCDEYYCDLIFVSHQRKRLDCSQRLEQIIEIERESDFGPVSVQKYVCCGYQDKRGRAMFNGKSYIYGRKG